MQRTLGGERLGSGKRMKVALKGYERSTHDLGFLFRSTISAGTLVPFMCKVALPGDTWDIDLDADIKTHPTTGPLFGSYKAQLDVFSCPVRLYQGQLHNNKLNIGRDMSKVKLPQIELTYQRDQIIPDEDPDNAQINPSCLLKYLGISGIGTPNGGTGLTQRQFNGIPLLAYWDIFKNYYANKMEDNAYVIHRPAEPLIDTVDEITINGTVLSAAGSGSLIPITDPAPIVITYTGASPILSQIVINATTLGNRFLSDVILNPVDDTAGTITGNWKWGVTGNTVALGWSYQNPDDLVASAPELVAFPLENLDTMREAILTATQTATPFIVNEAALTPYDLLLSWTDQSLPSPYLNTQEGLAVKTYQSDLFNNWLQTDWIDGTADSINTITAVALDPTINAFKIETLILAKKVYDMLNRVAVAGGSYQDWLEVTYDHEVYMRMETPVYEGGMSKELVFQEVISNSETETSDNSQPLGTLGGRGILAKGQKGGKVRIKVDEPAYIIGIVSLTPRIDYSQGNEWDTDLKTMNDFHKPALDEIGYQDLVEEQMAWWTTMLGFGGGVDTITKKAAGKQPAWLNYMTSVNKVFGNFAIKDNEMFMVLNRRYEKLEDTIKDLTTYIDPVKSNYSFADTAIDAQNFWVQISIDANVRRKMSAKIMPNL